MGRANGQQHAISPDAFSAVLGARRGRDRDAELQAQQAATDVALTAAQTGNADRVLGYLAGQLPLDPDSARVAPVLDALAGRLVADARDAWSPAFAHLAEVSGLRTSSRPDTLIYRRGKNIIHIWPDGRAVASELQASVAPQETVCGVAFTLAPGSQWRRPGRGGFQDPPNDRFRACSRCAKHAAEYPDATERRSGAPDCGLEPPHLESLLAKARSDARTGIVSAVTRAGAAAEDLESQMRDRIRAVLADGMLDEFQERGHIALERSIDVGSGHRSRLQRELGLDWEHAKDFKMMAAWLTRDDWVELVSKALPLTPSRMCRTDHDRWRAAAGDKVIAAGAGKLAPMAD